MPLPPAATPHAGPTTQALGPNPTATILVALANDAIAFQMPGVISGNTANLSAEVRTALPSSVAAPQAGHAKTSQVIKPATPGVLATGMIYLMLSTDASVEFAASPSFTFTLAQGTAIPSGSYTYVWYWDPYQNLWIHLLGPGTVNANTVTFAATNTDIKFNKDAQYIFALVDTSATVATASPAPTPAAGATPTPLPLAAYCSNYQANTSANAVPLNITDDSGFGVPLMVYIQNGNYMDNTGQFNSVNPYPLPAACFSNTLGSQATNKPLQIPQNAQGRVYFAYSNATPNPSAAATPPNPFGNGGVTFNPDYNDSPFPWDKIEYGVVPNGIMDTTQVDFMGLPIEMSMTSGALPHQAAASCPAQSSAVVGVSSCGYGAVFTAMSGTAQYNNLVITQSFNNTLYDLRVVAPKNALSFTSFQWNLFGDPSLAPSCSFGSTAASGYLQCVLEAYQNAPRLFTSNVPGAGPPGTGNGEVSGDWYCATSDGSANFIFTDIGQPNPSPAPGACVNATPNPNAPMAANPFKMPIQTLTYGIPPAKDEAGPPPATPPPAACQYNVLFGQPYGLAYIDNNQLNKTWNTGTGNLFSKNDAFGLWKALVADLNYGTVLSTTSAHPVGEFATKPLQMSGFWLDPMYNSYAKILHANFDHNLAYALAYDDLFGWSTSVSYASGDSINVRINEVPKVTAASAVPVPVGNPTCSTISPEIGTY